jgi:hypothetical protein
LRERLGDFGTNNIRWTQIWPDTWSMIQEEGFWGSGPGTYPHVFDQYREKFSGSNWFLEYAHNEFLHTLAEYGWIPFLLILCGVGWMMIRDTRASLKTDDFRVAMLPAISLSILIATFVQAVFDFHLHITANALITAMILGTLHGASAVRGVQPGPMLSTKSTRLLLGAVAGTAVLLLIPAVRLTMGSYYAYRGRLALEQKDTQALSRFSAKQRAWLPERYDGWRSLGLEKRKAAFWMRNPEQKQALIAESRAAYGEAVRLNPYDRISHAGQVELLKMEKRWEEALSALNELIILAPVDVQVRIQKGLVLKRMKRNQEALQVFEEARKMRKGPDRQIDLNIRSLKKRIADSSG